MGSSGLFQGQGFAFVSQWFTSNGFKRVLEGIVNISLFVKQE